MLSSTAFGSMFLVRWRRGRERFWLLGGISSLLYAAVLAALGALPHEALTTSLLVGLLAFSTTILLAAVRSFDGEREIDGWVIGPPLLTGLAYLLPLLLLGSDEPTVRMLNSVALAATMLATAWLILRRPTTAPASSRIVAVSLLGYLPCYAVSIAIKLRLGGGYDWLAAVPLLADQALLGVLNVGLLAMPGERDAARLREQALRDPLTGAWNRAGLDALVPRFGAGGAVIAIDVDHFKRINDRDGHGAGDAVLRRLADAIAAKRPRGAELVRLGGDEFALLLPDAASAAAIGETILAVGAAPAGLPAWTVSLGVGRILAGDAGLADALERADTMLYRAKAAGRARLAA